MGFLRRLIGVSERRPEQREVSIPLRVETHFEEPDRAEDIGDRRGPLPAEGLGLLSGNALEVVGESHHQDVILALIGGRRSGRVRGTFLASLIPEPDNRYDPDAVSVRIDGRHVGYVTRPGAKAYKPILARLTEAGRVAYCRADIVGGGRRESGEQASYGVFVYAAEASEQKELLDRELDGKSRAEIARARPALQDGTETGLGTYRGRHHSAWHAEAKRLHAAGEAVAAEQLLLAILDATEAEAARDSFGVAPATYESLAVIYRKRKDREAEIAILERFAGQHHGPGASPPKLLDRLAKLRSK